MKISDLRLSHYLNRLNLPLPRSVVIVTLTLGIAAIAVTPAFLNGGLSGSNIIFAVFSAVGGIALGIEYTRSKLENASNKQVACCPDKRRYNRLLEAWFFVSGIIATLALALIVFAIFGR
jgi:hypothetical protein